LAIIVLSIVLLFLSVWLISLWQLRQMAVVCRKQSRYTVSVEIIARFVDDWRLSIVWTGRVTGQLQQICVA